MGTEESKKNDTITFTYSFDNPNLTNTNKLSPEEQKLKDEQQKLAEEKQAKIANLTDVIGHLKRFYSGEIGANVISRSEVSDEVKSIFEKDIYSNVFQSAIKSTRQDIGKLTSMLDKFSSDYGFKTNPEKDAFFESAKDLDSWSKGKYKAEDISALDELLESGNKLGMKINDGFEGLVKKKLADIRSSFLFDEYLSVAEDAVSQDNKFSQIDDIVKNIKNTYDVVGKPIGIPSQFSIISSMNSSLYIENPSEEEKELNKNKFEEVFEKVTGMTFEENKNHLHNSKPYLIVSKNKFSIPTDKTNIPASVAYEVNKLYVESSVNVKDGSSLIARYYLTGSEQFFHGVPNGKNGFDYKRINKPVELDNSFKAHVLSVADSLFEDYSNHKNNNNDKSA